VPGLVDTVCQLTSIFICNAPELFEFVRGSPFIFKKTREAGANLVQCSCFGIQGPFRIYEACRYHPRVTVFVAIGFGCYLCNVVRKSFAR
jgi:hypothetical protein